MTDGWLKVGEKPFPCDGEDIFVIHTLWNATVGFMMDGKPRILDRQCGEGADGKSDIDKVVLWMPMPKGWRGLIDEHKALLGSMTRAAVAG